MDNGTAGVVHAHDQLVTPMPPEPAEYFDDVLYYAMPGGSRVQVGAVERWQVWWRTAAAELPADLAPLALRQGFALTTAQLRELDVARHTVRRRVASGRWTAGRRGVVSILDPDDGDRHVVARRRHALAAAASAVANGSHVVCGASAAIMRGLPTRVVPAASLLTVVPSRGTGRRATREATLHRVDLDFWFGVAVTGTARTVADLARHDPGDGLMSADAALHEALTSPANLHAALGRMAGWPGVRSARGVVALADGRSESPLESLTRLALHDNGFPPPLLQAQIGVPGRTTPYRVDFLWPDQRVILEVDGRGKYSDLELRRERRREADLRGLGYRIERVMWRDVVHDWSRTAAMLRAALAG